MDKGRVRLHTPLHILRMENGHVPKKLAADRGWSSPWSLWENERKQGRLKGFFWFEAEPQTFLIGGGGGRRGGDGLYVLCTVQDMCVDMREQTGFNGQSCLET